LIREKTGVWIGAYAENPINDEIIPIWIADYVLMEYGTGAVMGVPGGDERDFEFAKKYRLPIIPTYNPSLQAAGGEKVLEEILAGERCWTQGGKVIHGKSHKLDINGLDIEQAKNVVANWLEANQLGERCVTYKLRDWLFSRQRYWGEPFPILHFKDGTKRLLDLDELPLVLPNISTYRPQGGEETPLSNVDKWVKITDTKTGKKGVRETNTMPQWAGSCWYYLRFCDPNNDQAAWCAEAEKYWMPVDMYVGGVEHAVLHLLYARFWHKVLYDCGYVSTSEPFRTLRNQGLLLAKSYKKPMGSYVYPDHVEHKGNKCFSKGVELIEMMEKMSKSKLNGINPTQIIKEIGADSLRLYVMFMGPFDKEKIWDNSAISGCRRFLDRFYSIVTSNKVCDTNAGLKLAYRLVDGVERDIEGMFFNRAIAKMMEFINQFSKLSCYSKRALIMVTQALYPFAPHLAEECWEILGQSTSLAFAPYPKVDPKFLINDTVTYIVQVNGRLRDRWNLPKGKSKEELLTYAKKEKKIARHITGEIVKVIYVPDKLLNIVIKSV